MKNQTKIIFDGNCPFCNNFITVANLRKNLANVVFLNARDNREAQKIIKKTFYKYKHLKYIDLSADFRIQNHQIYKKNYGINHKAKNLIKESIYAISEFSRFKINIKQKEIRKIFKKEPKNILDKNLI